MSPRRQHVIPPRCRPVRVAGSHGRVGSLGPGVKKAWMRKRKKRKILQVRKSRSNCFRGNRDENSRPIRIKESVMSHVIPA
jgi:hypothetical protein